MCEKNNAKIVVTMDTSASTEYGRGYCPVCHMSGKSYLHVMQCVVESIIGHGCTEYSDEYHLISWNTADNTCILNQPFLAALRIIYFANQLNDGILGYCITATIDVLEYHIVQRFLTEKSAKDRYTWNIWMTQLGIPIRGSRRTPDLESVIGKDSIAQLLQYTENIPFVIDHERIRHILIGLLSRSYASMKPMNAYNTLRDHIGRHSFDELEKLLIGGYHIDEDKNAAGYHISNKEYSCASKLFFMDRPLLNDAGTIEFTLFVGMIREALQKKINETYGSCSNKASGAPIQKIVAQVLSAEYPDATCYSREMLESVMEKIRCTTGRYGDIYFEDISVHAYCYIQDFLSCRINTTCYYELTSDPRSMEHKIRAELSMSDMLFERDGVEYVAYDPSRVQVPHVISLDVDDETRELYRNSSYIE